MHRSKILEAVLHPENARPGDDRAISDAIREVPLTVVCSLFDELNVQLVIGQATKERYRWHGELTWPGKMKVVTFDDYDLAHLIRDAGQTLVHETVGRYEHGYKPEAPLRLHDGWVYDEQDA